MDFANSASVGRFDGSRPDLVEKKLVWVAPSEVRRLYHTSRVCALPRANDSLHAALCCVRDMRTARRDIHLCKQLSSEPVILNLVSFFKLTK